jgi:hypothetical protein
MNIFRLPVGWQFLVNNKLGGTLDSGNLAKYDQLVQGCLATGALCIIDVSPPSQRRCLNTADVSPDPQLCVVP